MNMNNIPYGHYSYQRAGQTWASFTTQLEAVAIEYMTCNAAAFADGDAVLVGFTDQDFSQPKVIGFKSNPQPCTSICYYLCRRAGGSVANLVFGTFDWTFSSIGNLPEPYERRSRAGGALISGKIMIVSGMHYDQAQVMGYPGPDTFNEIIDINHLFDPITYATETKQPIDNPREGLTGFGYDGTAYFNQGIKIYADAWRGSDYGSSGQVGCPAGFTCSLDSWADFHKSMGLYSRTDAYTLLGDSWENKSSRSTSGIAKGFGIEDELYIFGGITGKRTKTLEGICCYWCDGQNLSAPAFGGTQEVAVFGKSGKKYNATTNSWLTRSGLAVARAGHSSAAVHGKGYIFLGSTHADITGDDLFLGEDQQEPTDVPPCPGTPYRIWGYAAYISSVPKHYWTMSALEYDPLGGGFSYIEALPNNGGDSLGNRDNQGTGIAWTNESIAAIATLIGTIVVGQSVGGSGEREHPLWEYDPLADSYTGRAELDNLYEENDYGYGLGEHGYQA
jgi:hypothetical protein